LIFFLWLLKSINQEWINLSFYFYETWSFHKIYLQSLSVLLNPEMRQAIDLRFLIHARDIVTSPPTLFTTNEIESGLNAMFNPKFIEYTFNFFNFIFYKKGLWLLSLDIYLLYTCFSLQVIRVMYWNGLNSIPMLL
jgi:hypothetical protein